MNKPREWFGQAGHFVGGDRCRFHLHTHINGYCVSTVGEYFPKSSPDVMEPVGDGRMYETMVFRLDKRGEIANHNELDLAPYNDRDAANEGHLKMVNRWSRK